MRWPSIVSGCLVVACSSGSSPSGPGGPTASGPVTSITITSAAPTFTSLDEARALTAVARDAAGRAVSSIPLSWSSSDPSVVGLRPTAGGGAMATAVSNGNATITVASGSVTASTTAAVAQAVAALDFTEIETAVELPGDTAHISATALDARGNVVPGATITWSSLAPGVARVAPTGVVTATGFGSATIQATAEGFTRGFTFEVIGDRFFINGDVRLRYALDLPNDAGGPFPAVVWIHGPEMLDRNAQRFATDPLVPRGLAVLRYDKRGVGESTGQFIHAAGLSTVSSELRTLAGDAAAAVAFLERLPQIDPNRIGLMANSQGGWVAPLTAQQSDDVSFMMMWSGTTASFGLQTFFYAFANSGMSLDDAYQQLSNFGDYPAYEPMPVLRTVDIPSLWLFGGMDRIIPTRLDTVNMRTLQREGLPYEFVWLPGGRHDLRDNDSGTGPFIDVWSIYEAWLRRMNIL